jgi:nucleotide-binding universal stress UspA family protein
MARRISYDAIRRHQLRHLPVDQTAVREIIERRAAERGLRIAIGRGPLLTNAGVLEVIRQKGFEAIAAGGITPSIRETLEAARLLEELDQQGEDADFTVVQLRQRLGSGGSMWTSPP